MIGNSNINKVGSREVFEYFHEPCSAVDGSRRCMHVFKSFLVLSLLDRIKNAKIRRKTVAHWFLLIGTVHASKKHANGRGGEF